jgi:hypothetical protein
MGILTSDEEGHIESIVYFLTEALRAAVESGDSVQQSLCEAPQLSTNMTCGEIADRLAAYRKHLRAIWSYEVLLVAKIMRARELVKELRTLEPELKPEIDTFRLATVSAADLQDLLLPSAQKAFNSVDRSGHMLEEHGAIYYDGARADPLAGYRIAGHTDIRLLLSSCEAMHFALAARYALEPLPSRAYEPEVLDESALLDADDDVEAAQIDPTDDAFLLTEFCEIVPESGPAGAEWRGGAPAGGQVLPH